MSVTDGLKRGMEVIYNGGALRVPILAQHLLFIVQVCLYQLDTKLSIFETGIKVVDLLAPYRRVSVFSGVGERTREGNDLYIEIKVSGVLINEQNLAESNAALAYGHMNEPPGTRIRVDINEQDILIFIDNIFRFFQERSKVYGFLDIMPYDVARITSTKEGSITSIQEVYVPADDLNDPTPVTTFANLDATTVLSRRLASKGIYLAVYPIDSKSNMLQPRIIGEEHYEIAQRRFLSQPFFVAEVFTGSPGKYVGLEETIRGFQLILSGELDGLPEQAFYLVGNIRTLLFIHYILVPRIESNQLSWHLLCN
ncbi:hypothetical protein MKW92_043764 [Papaver armeniacum]|nr:hypothetical protein MKW92_043764 [Papaver armeniacum]